MDKEFLKKIKKTLEKEKKRLEKDLKWFAKRSKNRPDDFQAEFPEFGSKEDENAAEVALFGDRLALEGDLEHSLQKTSEALRRLKEGIYGRCGRCEAEIDRRRLMAFPAASLCIKCAQKKKM